MPSAREPSARTRPPWPELLVLEAGRARRDELCLALLVGLGGWLGVVFGAGLLVLASAPPPSLLRPADGVLLLARIAIVIPVPAVLGGRVALRWGARILSWGRGRGDRRLVYLARGGRDADN